eukprot:TRINITY_DN4276_c0_g1_i1.p2 TRINITY_DN4276_c0_g1~~TRINITY_DN4276_c0_g1_i1.p2  ORF type:complete len:272 (-),score=101.22 TRINITY_DN4276_c0_g1_i1:35-850(-)
MANQGTVKSFNAEKGYGFITAEADGKDYFVHLRDCGESPVQRGDTVLFDVEQSPVKADAMVAKNVTGGTGGAWVAGKWIGQDSSGQLGKIGSGAYRGVVKSFSSKGWGFAEYEGQDVFIHIRDCVGGRPQPGDTVAFDFDTKSNQEGKLKAINISGGTAPMDDGKAKGKGKDGGMDMGMMMSMMSSMMGKGDGWGPMWGGDSWGGCGGGAGWGPYGGDMGAAWKGKGMGKGMGMGMGMGKGMDQGWGFGGMNKGCGDKGFGKAGGMNKGGW